MPQRKKSLYNALESSLSLIEMDRRFYAIVEKTHPDIPEDLDVEKVIPYLKEFSEEKNANFKDVQAAFSSYYMGLLRGKGDG